MNSISLQPARRQFSPIRHARLGWVAAHSTASGRRGDAKPAAVPALTPTPTPISPKSNARPPVRVVAAGLLILVAVLLLAPFASAQVQNTRTPPHIGYVYPAGGKQGTTFVVSVGGQNLNGTNEALFTGAGISARITGYDRPLSQKELNDLREKLQELQKKRAASMGLPPPEKFKEVKKGKAEKETEPAHRPDPNAPRPKWTADDEKKLAEIRTLMAKRTTRQSNPALADTVTLELTIAADVAPGTYELRLKNNAGVSNPMVIQIGELPEFTKPVVTSTSAAASGPRNKRDPNQRPTRPQAGDLEITLPVVVNGQILPGEVDRYRFNAKKGQRLTVAVSARSLIPYLADAVPGWFQATVALFDPQGHELAYSDSFRFNPDPVVNFEIPADGTYAIEVKDSIYRGREDFVYRIAIGELPFVTSIFPLGGRNADSAKFELAGWNLPAKAVQMDTKDKAAGTFVLSVRNRGQLSNPVRFALDAETAIPETEPNDQVSAAQAVTGPVVVDGRIDKPGDQDVFKINGKAGEEVVAEVFARRLGSPLDSELKLTDAKGETLASNDDTEDKGVGLMTHHADSRIMLKLPADGTYYLTLADTQHNGGPEYGYRLRIGAPRPDFELRVVPSTVNVRAGTHVPITVYALRRDGFDGDIVLSLQNAPRGFGLSGARIPAGQDKVQLTLAAMSTDEMVRLTMVGAAMIKGQAVGHVAVPAEDMMQAFAYHHLVPSREWLINVTGRPGASCRLVTRPPIQLPLGGTTRVAISVPTGGQAAARRTVFRAMAQPAQFSKIAVELNDPPEGISVKSSSNSGDEVEVVLTCDPAKVKAGLKGNLILNAFGERSTDSKKGQRPQRVPLGSAPAVPFEIIASPVASK